MDSQSNQKILEQYEPKEVLRYFAEICSIPHGSGNIRQISDYLAEFAKAHGLFYIQEPCGNIIMRKPATAGYEQEPGLILQGHMDMVAVKDADCDKDMETEGLELCVEKGRITAKGTSLGGDDGIALAYAMAILAAEDIAHPELEFVATINEETGMDGAIALDASVLKGRMLLNLDSEEESTLLTGCAGGATLRLALPKRYREMTGKCHEIALQGLVGGHSGTEIDKNHPNALKLMTRVLQVLVKEQGAKLVSFEGGTKDNVIPVGATAVVCMPQAPELTGIFAELKNAYAAKEPGISLTAKECKNAEAGQTKVLCDELTKKLLTLLQILPYGVEAMSKELPGLVETSNNIGILSMSGDDIVIACSVRSLMESEKQELCERIRLMAELCGAKVTRNSEYPGWQFRRESPLRERVIAAYRTTFGREPIVQAIHAGLECGLLIEKLPDLDAISFGPDIFDIHTTKEAMDLASVQRSYAFLLEILRKRA